MASRKKSEKWLVTKAMHLGFIKYSVTSGTVIDHNLTENKIVIDGQEFSNVKDLDILKRNGWVEKYSEKRLETLQKESHNDMARRAEEEAGKKPRFKEMEVVQSDQDTHTTIDISHTKKQKASVEKKSKKEMEVVKYDETPEERKMPIVRDDTMVDASGETGTALNSSQVTTRTAEEHAKLVEEGKKKAQKGFTDERLIKKNPVTTDNQEEVSEKAKKTVKKKTVRKKAKKVSKVESE
jgi:hypothetical protein